VKNIIVQKYGGTSVGDINRLRKVANRIIKLRNEGNYMVVVVSAMGKTTDDLVKMAYEVHDNPPSREMDMLLATGEQISIALLAMAIEVEGYDVISLTGAQCGIQTTENHKKARIHKINTERIERELKEKGIVIVAGFQGINENKDITTLGRGGSDTSAVALAVALNAKQCEIYTDVDGVYTADPRVVKSAKLIPEMEYKEVLELASLGARVLHPRSIELAEKNKMKLVVRSSFNGNPGTTIKEDVRNMERSVVTGVSLDEDIAKISVLEVPDKPGTAFKLFSALSEANIHVDMIVQNVHRNAINDISFTVAEDELNEALAVTEIYAHDVNANEVTYEENVAKLSIVGTGIVANTDISSKFFESLYELGINIRMISTSELKISCVIDIEGSKEAMNHVHKKFIG
jgi:aspartate kinase